MSADDGPAVIGPAAELLPDGLEPLAAEARAEGIHIVDRVVTNWRDQTERYDRPGELLLAAVSGSGRPVGVGGLTVCPTVAGALRVRRFYVSPDWRRRGLARDLAARVLDGAVLHTELVTCNAGASDAAVPFWESLGFEPVDLPGITHQLRRAGPGTGPTI